MSSDLPEPTRPVRPWRRPDHVEIDLSRPGREVQAWFSESGSSEPQGADRVLPDLLEIARAAGATSVKRIKRFVERHALLGSPFHGMGENDQRDGHFINADSLAEYEEIAALVSAVLSVAMALRERRKPDVAHMGCVHGFLGANLGVEENLRILKVAGLTAGTSLWDRLDEPLPLEHRGRSGDLRKIWRAMQQQRVVEVFNAFARRGGVQPALTISEGRIVGTRWTGKAWGALCAGMADVLTGVRRVGVCAYCGNAYPAKVKSPRRTYQGRSVNLCCGELACVRAKRRADTEASRARARTRR